MKTTIHDNGATATINRVILEGGECRWRFTIDIKEKHSCKKAVISQGTNEITVFLDPYQEAPDAFCIDREQRFIEDVLQLSSSTCLHIEAETETEQYVLNNWTLLEDPGRHELRLWLVAPLDRAGLPDADYTVLFQREE